MKVLLQRSDGLFLKSAGIWVNSKADALSFEHCTPAIDFCVENGIKDARLCLTFGDTRYDLHLEVFRGETKALVKFNRELRRRRESLLRQLGLPRSEPRKRKEAIPFPRQSVAPAENAPPPSA